MEKTTNKKRIETGVIAFVAFLGLGTGIASLSQSASVSDLNTLKHQVDRMEVQQKKTDEKISTLVEWGSTLDSNSTENAEWTKEQVDTLQAQINDLKK